MNKWSKLVISAVVAGFVSHAAFANEEPATDDATSEAPKAEAGKEGCKGKGGCKGEHKKSKHHHKKGEKRGKKKQEAK